ncbi:MAG: hypothetical protein ACKVU1_13130 [bacterium]
MARSLSSCVVVALAAALALVGAAAAAALAQDSYVIEEIHPSTGVGNSSSIALNAAGEPCIAYIEPTGPFNDAALHYATKSGGAWTISSRLQLGGSGSYCSMDLDANGDAHIVMAELELAGRVLVYAKKTAASWIIELPDFAGPNGEFRSWPSIAVDVNGSPRIAYRYQTSSPNPGDLRIARKPGASWVVETVDGGADDVGSHASIAIAPSGGSHIAYYDQTNGDLKHAYKTGGSWIVETADAGPHDVGIGASIAVDDSGDVHVSYINQTNHKLKYARTSNGVWSESAVDDPSTAIARGTSIALDAAGKVHITYYDSLAQELRHAYKSGGAWNVEVIDATGTQSGQWSSLALDADDNAHVSYYSLTADEVRYATVDIVTSVEPWDARGAAAARPALVVYPNPALGGRVDVLFEIGGAAGRSDSPGASGGTPAAVDVFDIAGRRVRALALDARANANAGGVASDAGGGTLFAARWDGRDATGRDVAAGVYFMRVESGGRDAASRRVTVVR